MGAFTIREALGLELIDVQLRGMAPDGKPKALKIRQLSIPEWKATESGLPLAGIRGKAKDANLTAEEAEAVQKWSRDAVMRAVDQVRVPQQQPDGTWIDTWEPCRIVPNRTTHPNEIWIEDFDRRGRSNVNDVWNALMEDLRNGGEFASVKEANFHDREDVAAVGDGEGADVDTARGVPAET